MKCLNCNRETVNPKFCNASCSAKYNNKNRPSKKIVYNIVCLNCESNIVTHRKTKKFCSSKCVNEYKHAQTIKDWLNGENSGGSVYGASSSVKRYLRKIRGNKCEKCGFCVVNIYTNKVPLEVNHIDGNWKNNELSNLELLCPNCHSLTHNYKARNKGKGRPHCKLIITK